MREFNYKYLIILCLLLGSLVSVKSKKKKKVLKCFQCNNVKNIDCDFLEYIYDNKRFLKPCSNSTHCQVIRNETSSNQSVLNGSLWNKQSTRQKAASPPTKQQTYTLRRLAGGDKQLIPSLSYTDAMNNSSKANNYDRPARGNVMDINYLYLKSKSGKSSNSSKSRNSSSSKRNIRHHVEYAPNTTELMDFLHPPYPAYLRSPYFDFGVPRNITARSGQTAAINCRVEFLGDKSVSWIRKRDLHILTAGILTYTSDERFKVGRTRDLKNWSLYIKYAQPRDSGIYECQVNTEPKISMAFRLTVLVTPPDAKAFISGPSDLYVKIGSAITLTCHVKQPSTPHGIGPIYWYRGSHILTPFVVHPNEATIDMKRISMESQLGDKLYSRLRITNAQLSDTGNYTCMPTTANAASVMVHVINDENPAAMQKSCGTSNNLQSVKIMLTVLALMEIWHRRCGTKWSKF